jgi:peptidoglycan/xylan/chitin deacetylase (PgdA/CDA1 family)
MSLRQTTKAAFYQAQRRWSRWTASHDLPTAENAIVVFAMHAIAPAHSDMAIPVARFREQMRAVLEAGYRAITIDQLLAVLSGKTPLPGPAFAITFDDGYRNVLTEALPLLEALQIPATVFLTTGFLDGRVAPPWRSIDPNLRAEYKNQAEFFQPMSWDEARTLARHPLIRIGAHSDTHPLLGLLAVEEAGHELLQSKAIIRDRLGIETDLFAYPYGVSRYGAYSDVTERLLHKTGYRCSMTSEIARARVGRGSWMVPRISLTQEDEGPDAVAKAAGGYDWVSVAQSFYQSVFPNPHGGSDQ